MIKKIFIITSVLFLSASISFAQEASENIDAALDTFENKISSQAYDSVKSAISAIESEPAQIPLQQVKINETIDSLDIEDRSLDDILELISKQTGIVFITPDPMPQKVSFFIEDIAVWDLLKILLQQHDLAYYRTNGAVHIMAGDIFQQRYGYNFPLPFPTKIVVVKYGDVESFIDVLNKEKSAEGQIWFDAKNHQIMMIDTFQQLQKLAKIVKDQDRPGITEVFVLRNISYQEIKKDVEQMLSPVFGKITTSEDGKILTIMDTKEQIEKLRVFLNEADQQVVMDFGVKIVRINLNEENPNGVDWEAIVSEYQKYELKAKNGNGPMIENMSVGILTKEDYDVLIDALDTVGDLNYLIAFDSGLVLNQEGMVDFETNDPFWSLKPGIKKGPEGTVILDPNGFEMRTNLVLKRKDKQFVLEMLPRFHWMQTGPLDLVYVGETASVINFESSDVIVIGGLIRTEEISRIGKIPLLGDLPMLGGVFRRERKNFKNAEYIIFLTPQFSAD